MRIADSARKWAVTDADMLHATRIVLVTIAEQPGGRTLLIGVARDGSPLEVVVQDADDDTDPRIIHAMPLRPSYYRFLPKGVIT